MCVGGLVVMVVVLVWWSVGEVLRLELYAPVFLFAQSHDSLLTILATHFCPCCWGWKIVVP